MFYTLKNKIPTPCEDPIEWAKFFEVFDNRRVKYTELENFRVSTVFIGVNLNLSEQETPLFFETMVFPKDTTDDLECIRVSTWDQAVEEHDKLVEIYKIKETRI